MPVLHRRPRLTHMPHQQFARQEREAARLATLSRHEEHVCVACGVFGASRGFKPAGWEHVRSEAVWACEDPDCRRQAEAMVPTTFDRSAAV